MSSSDDLIPSYSFSVSLDGKNFSFSRVDNLSSSIDIETIVEGGFNNAPVILRKPKQNPDILILEKGTYTSLMDISMKLFDEGSLIRLIDINVLRNGRTVRTFLIRNGVVVRREYSTLDASESNILIQTLQIAHTGMVEVPLPFGI